METWRLGVDELISAYESGALTPATVVQDLLDRIERLDSRIGAFRQIMGERAHAEAETLTSELRRGKRRGALHGVPVAVKELFDVEGALGCYGSTMLKDRVSPSDAEVVRRLRDAGAIVIGTTRSHEFGWGITTQHLELGRTVNPWLLDRVPGGSSGGSAAALALGLVPLALGSDTGGSIRIPAAYCGVVGMKPGYGRVSKRGGVALAPSLDHPGPMARQVGDLLAALTVMAGYDPGDPTTSRQPLPELSLVPEGLGGLRVGTAADLHLTPLDEDYETIFASVLAAVAAAGSTLTEVAFPNADRIRPAFAAIQMAEAFHVHNVDLGTFPRRASEYGADVRRRLEMASEVDIRAYLSARAEAAVLRRRAEEVFEEVDVIVTPVAGGGPSTTARPDVAVHRGEEMPFRDLVMDYTVPQDLFGLPACTVRAGFDGAGVPVGVQFTAPFGREDLALRAAWGLEQSLGVAAEWPLAAENTQTTTSEEGGGDADSSVTHGR